MAKRARSAPHLTLGWTGHDELRKCGRSEPCFGITLTKLPSALTMKRIYVTCRDCIRNAELLDDHYRVEVNCRLRRA